MSTLQRLTIKDLEHLSGVKAHTIRIWEKRYSLFEPMRSATNIRSYSNNDLKKLLNIVSILNSGKRISHVCSMSNERIHSELEQLQAKNYDSQIEIEINKLIVATMDCDVASYEEVCQLNQEKLGLEGLIERLIYPLLNKIGLLWTVSKLNPAQEHFASQYIRQKLFSAIDNLPQSEPESEKWMLFLPENEDHEIALLYAYYLIRKAGFYVLYLGSNLPLKDAVDCAKRINTDNILCFFTIPKKGPSLGKYLELLSSSFPKTPFYYSGLSADYQSVLPQNFHLLQEISDLKKLL